MKKVLIVSQVVLLLIINVNGQTMREGWPYYFSDYNLYDLQDCLAVYELDDGRDIIASSTNYELAVLDLDGNLLPGWPVIYERSETEPQSILRGPRLGDVDGDGSLEVVVRVLKAHNSTSYLSTDVYNLSGELVPEFSKDILLTNPYRYFSQSSPVLVDLDQDNDDEILVLLDSLYIYDDGGLAFPGYPISIGTDSSSQYVQPVVGLGENWGFEEPLIVWGTKHFIHAKFLNAENEVEGYPIRKNDNNEYAPLTLIAQENGWLIASVDADSVYAWNEEGEYQNGFPVEVPVQGPARLGIYDIVAGDITGDNNPELVIHQFYGSILAYNTNGVLVWAEDLAGLTDPVIIIKDNSSIFSLLFTASLGTEDEYSVLNGYRFPNVLTGFPAQFTVSTAMADTKLLAVIPSNDTLNIVCHASEGATYVVDYPHEPDITSLEWQMPGNNAGGNRFYSPVQMNAVEGKKTNPGSFEIKSVYPNPWNASVNIEFTVKSKGKFVMSVYNTLGQIVFRDKDIWAMPGKNKILWDGIGRNRERVSSGIYFIKLSNHSSSILKKTILLQ